MIDPWYRSRQRRAAGRAAQPCVSPGLHDGRQPGARHTRQGLL